MVALVPQNVQGHVDMVRNLAPRYWKGISDLTVRNFLTMYNLRKYGRLTFNAKGHTQVWNARIKQPQVAPAVENQPISFVNWDTDIQYFIGIKGYRGTDFMGELEYLQSNGAGDLQITDRYTRKSSELAQAMSERIQRAFWLNGNLAANAYDLAGIATALQYDPATCGPADKIALPLGSYCGQNTALGSLGGTWTADETVKPNASLGKDFPFGQGSPEYDGTSPLIINYASTAWGTSSTTWAKNAVAAVAYAQTAMLHRGGQSMVGAQPQVSMASAMFPDFKNSFRENNRQIMPWRDGDLGYPGDTMMVDGAVFSMDYSIPANNAYMYLPQYLEAFFLHNDIYGPMGPDWSTSHTGYLYYISSYGNYKFLPKYLCRFVSETA